MLELSAIKINFRSTEVIRPVLQYLYASQADPLAPALQYPVILHANVFRSPRSVEVPITAIVVLTIFWRSNVVSEYCGSVVVRGASSATVSRRHALSGLDETGQFLDAQSKVQEVIIWTALYLKFTSTISEMELFEMQHHGKGVSGTISLPKCFANLIQWAFYVPSLIGISFQMLWVRLEYRWKII